ncbi:MAG: hypothetical protein ACHQ17_12460 [Polyangia bacterium]|jgi:hypothetical protein
MNTMRNLVLAQAVSELAALLEFRGQTGEATILRGEANTLAVGRPARGLEALSQLNRIRGGIQTVMKLPLSADEQAMAETVALRIQRALKDN